MLKLPPELEPTDTLQIPLPNGSRALLPVCRPLFMPWAGDPAFTYGGKPLLDCRGEAGFAELVILRLLVASGWKGVWVETYGGLHYLRTMPVGWSLRSEHVTIPPDKEAILRNIQRTGNSRTCFDVFAWHGEQVLFCEEKRIRKDNFTVPQLRFIQGAITSSIPLSSLLVVEWDITRSVVAG